MGHENGGWMNSDQREAMEDAAKAKLAREGASNASHHCPTCDSPSPNLHPAMQFEGEVQPCKDPWHSRGNRPPACEICGEPMPAGEEMFKFHGHSGPCPKPPLPKQGPQTDLGRLLQAIVQSIGATDQRAFVGVDIAKAIAKAEAL